MILKTPDNPSGCPLDEVLGRISVELQSEGMRRSDPHLTAAVTEISGLLLQAQGVHRRARAQGCAIDSFPMPRLAPGRPR